MQKTTALSERLRELRKKKNLKATELASALSISRSRVSNWESGLRIPQREELIKLADFLDVSPAYLMGWISEDVYSTHQPIEQHTITLGDGSVTTIPGANSEHAYSETFLKRHGLKARQLTAITVDDDAMKHLVCKGDTILVDRQITRAAVRDLFAILINNRVWVRWIRPEIGGDYTVSAEDAHQYKDQTIDQAQLDNLDIIGRVTRIERNR